MNGVRVGQVWEQVSKHERGMQLEVRAQHRAPLGAAAGRRWPEQEAGLTGGFVDLELGADQRHLPVDRHGNRPLWGLIATEL